MHSDGVHHELLPVLQHLILHAHDDVVHGDSRMRLFVTLTPIFLSITSLHFGTLHTVGRGQDVSLGHDGSATKSSAGLQLKRE